MTLARCHFAHRADCWSMSAHKHWHVASNSNHYPTLAQRLLVSGLWIPIKRSIHKIYFNHKFSCHEKSLIDCYEYNNKRNHIFLTVWINTFFNFSLSLSLSLSLSILINDFIWILHRYVGPYDFPRVSIDILKSLINCDFSSLDIETASHGFLFYSRRSIPYISCVNLNKRKTTLSQAVNKCLHIWKESCESSKFRIIKVVRLSLDWMEKLLQTFPNLVVVHLVRDPRAIQISRSKDFPLYFHFQFNNWVNLGMHIDLLNK